LVGRLDLGRVGVAGHSFGAWTTLAVAGQAMPRGGTMFLDPRVRAAVAMSAPTPPALAMGADAGSIYGGIKIPILHMTGTEDEIPPKLAEARAQGRRAGSGRLGGRPGSGGGNRPLGGSAVDRRIPYDNIDKATSTRHLPGGDHPAGP
jgi:pimeloyl-ACP methyl ester carboxylesterase